MPTSYRCLFRAPRLHLLPTFAFTPPYFVTPLRPSDFERPSSVITSGMVGLAYSVPIEKLVCFLLIA